MKETRKSPDCRVVDTQGRTVIRLEKTDVSESDHTQSSQELESKMKQHAVGEIVEQLGGPQTGPAGN